MDFRLDSYCGLYCGACDVLIANWNGTIDELAQAWDMHPDDLRCWGCKSDTVCIYCTDCTIRQCAQSRQIEFCFECEDFPCDVHYQQEIFSHKLLDIIKGMKAQLEQ